MAPQTAIQEAIGNAQQLFKDNAQARRAELVESGMCEPCSIVNFNPVELKLQGELQRYSVPTADDKRLPEDVLRLTIPFDGRDRRGHIITIREPHVYGKNIGATWHPGGGPGEAIVQREPMHYLPVAIGYMLLEHFSPIFITGKDGMAAPPPKDARNIYGVLAFRGDIHTLERLSEEEDPARRRIHVPLATVRQVGKLTQRSYKFVETSFDDYLEKMFAGQLMAAKAKITRAQQRWNGTDEDRKDISDADRIWYRWAIRMGYAEGPKQGEKSWLHEMLTLPGEKANDLQGRRKCPACKALEPEADTPFCQRCNTPMDTFKTFMAGHPVAESFLQVLPDDQWEIVKAELERRQSRRIAAPATPAPLVTGVAATAATARGPYKAGTQNKTGKKEKEQPEQPLPGLDD